MRCQWCDTVLGNLVLYIYRQERTEWCAAPSPLPAANAPTPSPCPAAAPCHCLLRSTAAVAPSSPPPPADFFYLSSSRWEEENPIDTSPRREQETKTKKKKIPDPYRNRADGVIQQRRFRTRLKPKSPGQDYSTAAPTRKWIRRNLQIRPRHRTPTTLVFS